jgi:ribose 5-phosphate isomerase A
MEELKRMAAEKAVELVEDGMVVGLGTGSTVYYAIRRIGETKRVVCVPTSLRTEKIARDSGIPMGSVEDFDRIDVTIDGADEIDIRLNLTKGLGGALYREKVVAQMSDLLVIVADESKTVRALGEKAPLPVEVMPFGHMRTMAELKRLGCSCSIREQLSDNGNMLVDCDFGGSFPQPLENLAGKIKGVTGVVEHGLFLGLADVAFIGGKDGVAIIEKRD